jgi:glycosyltransferase involved in cell wall biosynthesis
VNPALPTETPRLVHLAEYSPPHAGSFIPMMRATLIKARERGWRAEAVFPRKAEGRAWIASFEEAGIPVRYTEPMSPGRLTRWIGDLLDEEQRPTLLHAHFSTYDVPSVLASRRRAWSAVFWHTHTVLPSDRRSASRNALKNLLFSRDTARILCPAQNIADAMGRRLAPRDRLWVFPSPIDTSEFPTLEEGERAGRRRALGLPQEATVLLLFGRDWMVKGGDTYMDAVRLIVDRAPGNYIALVHHGGETAVKNARQVGLEGILRDIGTRDSVQDLFGAADILLAPSRGEGMPFSVLESICTGTPVVASKLPGHSFLPPGYRACVVVDRDPEQVAAAALKTLAAGRASAATECDKARDWISANLSLDAATTVLLGAYEPVLERLRP